ncbi:MAG: GNAT family N-acetyltransferase [Gammaproteobacteria bacterium]|nr:GNAT family N-acetyltransferase [Gammaproteobacteria bacterium]MBT8133382.1 GNAT family N-acetyltransferase [Gammaproteobacteria bacterium]NNJ49355.1 GNAT family N-acetyltransferase [Gammaproteobacteria bacterium]
MKIVNLKDEPENLSTLASWHQDEWSHLNPGEDLTARILRMQPHLSDELIPSTFVAKDDVLLGSAAIVDQDMKTEPQLKPWLASVFVRPEYRKQGIGRKLVLHVMAQAQAAHIGRLYLYTPDKTGFYLKLGWSILEQRQYQNHEVIVMQVNLNV